MHWSACFSLYMIYHDMKRGNFNFFHLSENENGIQKALLLLQECFVLVTQERFELTTHRLEGGCSIQLSY